jgi:hypothetical protein
MLQWFDRLISLQPPRFLPMALSLFDSFVFNCTTISVGTAGVMGDSYFQGIRNFLRKLLLKKVWKGVEIAGSVPSGNSA